MENSIMADAYIKALRNQLHAALDALAFKEAELAQSKFDVALANQKLDAIMAEEYNANQGTTPVDSGSEG